MNEDHYYLVKMMPHEKGKERTLAERTISRCFLGYSSFEDVIEVEQRRKTRTSNDRSRIRDLNVENRVVKREMKELHVKIKILEQESSSLKGRGCNLFYISSFCIHSQMYATLLVRFS